MELTLPVNASSTLWNNVEDVYTIWTSRGRADREVVYDSDDFTECVELLRDRHEWARKESALRRKAFKWLTETKRFSPWIDWVNVSKAVDFHYSAWEAMTAREFIHIVDRLAKLPQHMRFEFGLTTTQQTIRMHRWYIDFSDAERERIESAVKKRMSGRIASL